MAGHECDGCIYWRYLAGGTSKKTTRWGYACHYLLDEGRRRRYEPGKDCSRRTVGKVKNESKRLVNEGAAP